MDVQLLAIYQESLAVPGPWIGVLPGDKDNDSMDALLAVRPIHRSQILQSLPQHDSDCEPQTWFVVLCCGRISKTVWLGIVTRSSLSS